jgi:hypothetical protein
VKDVAWVVAQRRRDRRVDHVDQQPMRGIGIAGQHRGDAAQEPVEELLLRVGRIVVLRDLASAFGEAGQVAEPKPGEGKLAEDAHPLRCVGGIGGGLQQVDGGRHGACVLLEGAEGKQDLGPGGRRRRAGEDFVGQPSGTDDVSGQQCVGCCSPPRRRRQARRDRDSDDRGTNDGPLILNDIDRLIVGTDAIELAATGQTMDITGIVMVQIDSLVAGERHDWPAAEGLVQLGLAQPRPAPDGWVEAYLQRSSE